MTTLHFGTSAGRARWPWTYGLILVLSASVPALVAAGGGLHAEPPDAARVAQGRAVYEAHCAACHGENLQGQPNWQEPLPNGRMPPPPHDASGHTWHHPDAMLFGIIQRGMAPYAWKGYEGDMPAFGGVLTDDEIRAVLAYIKSTWPEKVRAYQSEIDERARRRAASRSTSQSGE